MWHLSLNAIPPTLDGIGVNPIKLDYRLLAPIYYACHSHLVGHAKPHIPVLNEIWDWQPAPVEQSTSKNTQLLAAHALQLEAVWIGPNLLRCPTPLLQCPLGLS